MEYYLTVMWNIDASYNMDEPWKHAKWKKLVEKDSTLCGSYYMK